MSLSTIRQEKVVEWILIITLGNSNMLLEDLPELYPNFYML